MERLEKARLKYFKSIKGAKDNVKSNLLRLVFNLPRLEYMQYDRLYKVVRKYRSHFGESPMIFDEILAAFSKRLPHANVLNDQQRLRYSKGASIVMARQEGIKVNKFFISTFQRHYYQYSDKRDKLVINFFLRYANLRKDTLVEIAETTGIRNSNLEEALFTMYFCPNPT